MLNSYSLFNFYTANPYIQKFIPAQMKKLREVAFPQPFVAWPTDSQ